MRLGDGYSYYCSFAMGSFGNCVYIGWNVTDKERDNKNGLTVRYHALIASER